MAFISLVLIMIAKIGAVDRCVNNWLGLNGKGISSSYFATFLRLGFFNSSRVILHWFPRKNVEDCSRLYSID